MYMLLLTHNHRYTEQQHFTLTCQVMDKGAAKIEGLVKGSGSRFSFPWDGALTTAGCILQGGFPSAGSAAATMGCSLLDP